MPRNVEIKARIDSVEALLPRAQALADGPPQRIVQDDCFFACTHGRLKLRAFIDTLDGPRGELIFYRRADDTGPKTSHYRITPTHAPDALRDTLARACGVIGRVRKQRLLLLAGRTRIHLDRVEGLGDFLELEVVLANGEPAEQGVAEAHALMRKLSVADDRCVAGAYVDLLAEQSSSPASAEDAPPCA